MKKKFRLKKKQKDLIFVIAMLILPMLWFGIFWVYVNFNSILMAFKQYKGAGQYEWTLNNFKDIFAEFKYSDSVLKQALTNTLLFFPLNLITIFFSLFFSFLFYKKTPGHGIFRVVFYLPSIISGVIMATLFKNIIGPSGPIALMLQKWFGYTKETLPYFLTDDKTAMGTILVFTFWTSFGLNIIMFGGAMARVPKEVIEAGKMDGCGFFREFFGVMIPMIWPTISTVLLFALSGIFMASGATLLLTNGGYNTMNISLFIYQNVTANSFEYPAAVGLLFTLIGMPIVFIGRFILNKINSGVEY